MTPSSSLLAHTGNLAHERRKNKRDGKEVTIAALFALDYGWSDGGGIEVGIKHTPRQEINVVFFIFSIFYTGTDIGLYEALLALPL